PRPVYPPAPPPCPPRRSSELATPRRRSGSRPRGGSSARRPAAHGTARSAAGGGATLGCAPRLQLDHLVLRVGDPLVVHPEELLEDRKSTRLNSSHEWISYAVF